MILEINGRSNDIAVPSFILSGAPFAAAIVGDRKRQRIFCFWQIGGDRRMGKRQPISMSAIILFRRRNAC
ncbi:hypothetical protein [Mesorhizobium prunaredense]|uniref:hypothetical protein n=1 Tax=Mesorhizobium prunaredense TaxID=1631249 RepID=UPI0009873942|nr:hypothetical protein [Mesorhizobium prunaredense]